jgi:hypothetical protein
LISAQVLFISFVSSNIVLRHVFLGLPILLLPWGFPPKAACSVDRCFPQFMAQPSQLAFLTCQSILSWSVRFHSPLFDIRSGQKIPKMEETVRPVSTCGRELLRKWWRPIGLMVIFMIFTALVRNILDKPSYWCHL